MVTGVVTTGGSLISGTGSGSRSNCPKTGGVVVVVSGVVIGLLFSETITFVCFSDSGVVVFAGVVVSGAVVVVSGVDGVVVFVGVVVSGIVVVVLGVDGVVVFVGVVVFGVVVVVLGVDGVDVPDDPDELPPVGPTVIPILSLDELLVTKRGLLFPAMALPARTTGATDEVVSVGVDVVVVLTTDTPLLEATPERPPKPDAAVTPPTMFAWRPRRLVVLFITNKLLPITLSIQSINGGCRHFHPAPVRHLQRPYESKPFGLPLPHR